MNIDEILETLRKRRRAEWRELYREKWINARIWVQENAEKAFVVAIILGVILVLFFKLVVSLAFLVLILGAALFFLADPTELESGITTEEERPVKPVPPADEDNGPAL